MGGHRTTSEQARKNISAARIGKHRSEGTKKKIATKLRGTKRSVETLQKMRRAGQECWTSPDFVKKQMSARHVAQNKAEKFLESLLDQFPGFEFVGDGKKIISGKCPDFVNEEKHLIIELFGDYWHEPEEIEPRVQLFESMRYRALVIWEHELKDPEKLIQRIKEFTNG